MQILVNNLSHENLFLQLTSLTFKPVQIRSFKLQEGPRTARWSQTKERFHKETFLL